MSSVTPEINIWRSLRDHGDENIHLQDLLDTSTDGFKLLGKEITFLKRKNISCLLCETHVKRMWVAFRNS